MRGEQGDRDDPYVPVGIEAGQASLENGALFSISLSAPCAHSSTG